MVCCVFLLQQQSWVVATETYGPKGLQYLLSGPLHTTFADPWSVDLESLMLLVLGVWCREEVKIRTWFIISQKKNLIVSIQWWGLGTSVRNSTGQRVQPQLAIPPWASLPP